MNSNNQTAQNYSNLPMGNNSNEQHNIINDVFINTATPQNDIFVFYFPLPNDTRIYRVTYQYAELLHPLENARLLNNSINLSGISNHQFPPHNNIHSLIQQQIQQQFQQPVYQQNTESDIQQQFQQPVYQQNTERNVQQQFSDIIQSTSQDNNAYCTASNSTIGTISDNIQDMGFQNSP
jgi:hypothetical protein